MKNFSLKIFFTFLLTLFVSISIFAQEAIKIGEQTKLPCDLGEAIGIYSLKIELDKNPEYKGTLIVFGPQKGLTTRYVKRVKNWSESLKSPNLKRISYYYGGFREKMVMELWTIPKNAKEPFINSAIEYKNSTHFDNYTYQKNPYCEPNISDVLKSFADELRQYPSFKGYIIGYGVKDNDSEENFYLNQVKRKITKDKQSLIKLGIPSSRIKTIVGGYDDVYPHAELWIVPEGAEPPKPTLSVKNASNFVKN